MKFTRGTGPAAQVRGADRTTNGTLAPSILLALAAGLTACGETSSSVGATGDGGGGPTYNYSENAPIVAQLRVLAPSEEHFFLHGTIPVPRGTFVDGSLTTPLSVVSQPADAFAITQVEAVSHYPDAEDGADVVEIIAHVRRPAVAPGTPLVYDVAFNPHAPESFELSDDVASLLDAPGALRLVASDPFGHEYAVDLMAKARAQDPSVDTLRRGSLVWETRTPDVLVPTSPVAGPQGTLPHMMGVQAYVRRFARQDFFALDLLVHNGFDGMDASTPLDDSIPDLYFRSLDLVLPQGWEVVHVHDDPYNGPAVAHGTLRKAPIVGPLPGGRMHLMHNQSQFSRRLIVARTDAVDLARVEAERQSIGFCVAGSNENGAPLWSWWNGATARFMPQNHRLPDLGSMTSREALDSEYTGRLQARLNQVSTGAPSGHPVPSGGLGWAHPYGVAYGGMTGGERIDQIPGVEVAWSGSQSAYRYTELRSKMTQERNPFALYASDGDPTRYEDHVRTEGNPNGNWLPFSMMLTLVWNQTYFFQDPIEHQAAYVASHGLKPAYEDALRSYMPIDLQHHIRYSNDLLTLTWLGNDSLAREQLLHSAELYRMTHHDGYSGTGNFAAVATMRAKKDRIEAFPGTGCDYRRGEAWGLFTATAAYAIGDTELRERFRPWLAEVARTVRAGQSDCTGNIMSSLISGKGDGTTRTRQAFEVSFIVNALESMRTSVFQGVDPEVEGTLVSSIVDCAYSTIQAPFWDDSFGGLRNVTAVGMQDGSVADFCQTLPPNAGYGSTTIETQSPMTVWAYGYALTGDGEFLTKAAQAVGQSSNLVSEISQLGPSKLAHSAFLLGLVQELGAAQ